MIKVKAVQGSVATLESGLLVALPKGKKPVVGDYVTVVDGGITA